MLMNARKTKKPVSGMISAVQAQRKWIDEHGGCLAGYVEKYGEERGPAIYAADNQELQRLVNKAYRYGVRL